MISRVCEEFQCLPWQAEDALDRDPEQVFDILQLRAYAKTKRAVDNAKTTEQMNAITSPLKDTVFDIMFALNAEQNE